MDLSRFEISKSKPQHSVARNVAVLNYSIEEEEIPFVGGA